MVIEYDKSISSSVAQKQILIPIFNCLTYKAVRLGVKGEEMPYSALDLTGGKRLMVITP